MDYDLNSDENICFCDSAVNLSFREKNCSRVFYKFYLHDPVKKARICKMAAKRRILEVRKLCNLQMTL